MIAWFRRWRERAAEARRERAALAVIEQRAVSAFSVTYPDRRAPAARAHPCASGHVAIVMWAWDMRPPRRSFWLVDADGVREIDHDRAATLIRVSVWR